MLIAVGLAAAVAWAFFKYMARLVVWSYRPKFDLMRYAIITLCLSIEIGDTFEWWEAALLAAVSVLAYGTIRRQRTRFESAMKDIVAQGRRFAAERGKDPFIGS
ncbi:MAG: hypothetical protein K2X64_02755 [Rhodocyclaceae bacterium]|nr:hypothetical protein [Rhodocyclaceae bacterium]